jgi:hypothetical protein
MTKEGVFNYTQTIVGNGSIETFTFSLPDIPVMVSVALPPSFINSTLAHVVLYLTANGDRIAILGQGMINNLFGIAWPHQFPGNREQTEGAVVVVTQGSPAAGEGVQFQVGTNEALEILAIRTALIAAAAVGSRTVSILITAAAGEFITRKAGTPQIISETVAYNFIPGGTTALLTASALQEVALPPKIYLPPGGLINISHTNGNAGDQYGTTYILCRRAYQAQLAD